jgi:hypothetical protein
VDTREKLPKIENKNVKNNVNGNNSGITCSCGRLDEKEEMKNIKEQIFENFNERIQLRRAMM